MSEPFLAEVKMFGFNFPPRRWAQCDGQILPIDQNQSLFALLGTTYGGDGRTTFGLPDLRGRAPIHVGNSATPGSTDHSLGQRSGEEGHVLTLDEMVAHTHQLRGTDATPASPNPSGNRLAPGGGGRTAVVPYGPADNLSQLANAAVGQTGGTPHNTMQPYQVVNFCIAIQGTFPPRN
jgi:microcystin-dependent protein